MSRKTTRFTLMPVLAAVAGGCASKNPDLLHFLREHKHQVSAIEYRVGIPDSLQISAPQALEINGMAMQIQPDGKIHLPLLDDVKVTGMTAKEISAKLEVLLSRYYVDPKVSVRIAGYNSKRYYVLGQVGGQGARPYTGRDTLLDAILRGGVNHTSWTSRVKVIRPSHGEVPIRTIVVDVDRMTKTGDWSKNILLEPDDVVYVPPTPVAWLGQRVRELLSPVVPLAQAYLAPAEIMALDDVYDEESRGRTSGRFTTLGQRF